MTYIRLSNILRLMVFLVTGLIPLFPAAQEKITLDINMGHPGKINFMQPSGDGRYIYVQGGGYFKKWDLQSRSAVNSFRLDMIGDLYGMVDEANNHLYLAACVSPGLNVLDLKTGANLKRIGDRDFPNSAPMALDSAKGLLYICSQVDNSLTVVSTKTDSIVHVYKNVMPMAPQSMGLSHDGALLVISSGRSTGITKTADSYISIGDTSGKPVTSLFRAADASLIREIDHPLYESVKTEFSEDDSRLLTVCVDSIKVWNTHDYSLRCFYTRGSDSACLSAHFNKNGDRVLAGVDKNLMLIDALSGRLLDSIAYPFSVDIVKDRNNLQTKPALGSVQYLPDNRYAIASYLTDNDNLLVWDLALKKAVSLQTKLVSSELVLFNHKGSVFVTSGNDNIVRAWDASNNQLVALLRYHSAKILSMDFSPDDRYMLTGGEDGKIVLWDMADDTAARVFTEHSDRVLSVKFTSDNRHFVSGAQDNKMKYWSIDSLQSLCTVDSVFTNKPDRGAAGVILIDGNRIIVSMNEENLGFYHLAGNMILRDTLWKGFSPQEMTLSPDGKYLISFPLMEKDSLFSLGAMKRIPVPKDSLYIKLYQFGTGHITYDQNKRRLLAIARNNILLLDLVTLKQIYYTDLDGNPKTVAFHPLSGFLSVGSNNAIKLWSDRSDSLKLNTFAISGTADYVSVTAGNFYQTTKRGIESLGFKYGGQHFLFEQFDYLLDRPDKVLQEWPGSNKSRVALLKDAYLEHLKILHYNELEASNPDPENLPLMELNLVHPAITTVERSVRIRIKAEHSRVLPLRRLLLWSNNVPLSGDQGFPISVQRGLRIDTTITVNLLPGTNYISAAVLDKGGRMSRIDQVIIESCGQFPKPDLYLVTIGINTFDHINEPLFYAEKDADNIDSLFNSQVKFYGVFHNLAMRGSRGTADTFDRKKFTSFIAQAKENDRVVVFISSHGMLDGTTGVPRTFLAMKKTQQGNLDRTALNIDLLETLLTGSRCRNKAVFIDACHAGKEPPWTKPEASGYIVLPKPPEFAGDTKGAKDANDLMLPNLKAFSLMESTFRDSQRKGGVTIISASGGLQVAQERKDWENGAFTKTLLNGVNTGLADAEPKDGKITLKELGDYIFKHITDLKVSQQPTYRSENLVNDFQLF